MTYLLARVVDRVFHFTVTEEQQQLGLDHYHYGTEKALVAEEV
jgi:hypothetical protein